MFHNDYIYIIKLLRHWLKYTKSFNFPYIFTKTVAKGIVAKSKKSEFYNKIDQYIKKRIPIKDRDQFYIINDDKVIIIPVLEFLYFFGIKEEIFRKNSLISVLLSAWCERWIYLNLLRLTKCSYPCLMHSK